MRRTLAVLAILTFIATACGSDDEAGTTPASSTQDTSNTATAPTSDSTQTTESTEPPPSAPTTNPPPADHVCPHRNELLFARSLLEPLPRAGSNADLVRITAPTELVENMTAEDINALAGQNIGLYEVPPAEDPLDVAIELEGLGVAAAPILLVTPTGHWTFGPGGPFQDESGDLPGPPPPEADAPIVGVVDTGFTSTGATVDWITDHVVAADSILDAEQATLGAIQGHGMFVASVIVRNVPKARVIVAGMANVPPDGFVGVNQGQYDDALSSGYFQGAAAQFGKGYSTDELQLYFAVRRLLNTQLLGEFTFSALNLSVGSYQCEVLSDEGMAIWAALDLWYDGTNEAPVVAAAGNHGSLDPTETVSNDDFIPGQMGGLLPVEIPGLQSTGNPSAPATVVTESHTLYGVQSVKPTDTTALSDFSNPGALSAVGENVCGVRVDGQHTTWSGSSFATAVMTAAVVEGANLGIAIGSPALSDGCTIPNG